MRRVDRLHARRRHRSPVHAGEDHHRDQHDDDDARRRCAQRRSAATATASDACAAGSSALTGPRLAAGRRRSRTRSRSPRRSRSRCPRPRRRPPGRGSRSRRPARRSSSVASAVIRRCAHDRPRSYSGKSLRSSLTCAGVTGVPAVAPGDADVGDDGRHFVVVQDVRERRHAVRPRVLPRPRRVAAVQHHADRVDRRRHRDRLVARERRVGRRVALAFVAVAHRALLHVDLAARSPSRAGCTRRALLVGGRLRVALRQRLQVHRHRRRRPRRVRYCRLL